MRNQVIKSGRRPPWIGLSAAVWVEIAAGNAFTFPLYSHALKSVLGYNQQQLTMLGVANDVGESIAFVPGYASTKFPPWMLLFFGACACFLGYGLIWLSVSQILPRLPFFLLWIALIVAANSNAWFGTAVLVTNMRNFPFSRGTVAGILKGYAAIGGAVYTVIYNVFLDQSSTNLLMFLALGIPIICLAMMCFIRPCVPASGEDSSENVHFRFTQVMAFLAAFIVLIITVVGHVTSVSSSVTYTLVGLVFVLLVSPLAIPLKMTFSREEPNPLAGSAEGETDITNPLLNPPSSLGSSIEMEDGDDNNASDVQNLLAEGEGAVEKKKRGPRRGEDFTLIQAFFKADFWLLWFLYFLGIGSGVTVLNNLAQVGIAIGVDNTTVLVCLFSFFNFVGRLSSGAISEHFVKSRAMPRTVWMTIAQILMVVAFILYALSSSATLYPATALLGTCYGIQYSLMVPTASELFGLEHFGIIYSFMILGNPIGASLFSGLLAGYVYDAEAIRQGSSTCYGPDCFRLTFLILASLCGVAAILGVILTIRIRPVYRSLYGPRSSRQTQEE